MICPKCETVWMRRDEDLQVNGEYRGHTESMCADILKANLDEAMAESLWLRESREQVLDRLEFALRHMDDGWARDEIRHVLARARRDESLFASPPAGKEDKP